MVIAMEHWDSIGARLYINASEGSNSPQLNQDEEGSSQGLELKHAANRKQYGNPKKSRGYKVDYIFPKDNAQDTAPHNPIGVDHELRDVQINMRLAGIQEAFKILQVINNGDPEDRFREKNLKEKPNCRSSSCGLDSIHWPDWKGRLSLEKTTAMGHNFGGVTTMQTLRLNNAFVWIGQGILLDAWGLATLEVQIRRVEQITKLLLSIGPEAFMHWRENYDKVERICQETQQNMALSWMMTVRGPTHISQTDFAVLFTKWMHLFIKTLIHPERGIFHKVILNRARLRPTTPAPG